jgi:hypothetical protein
METLYQRRAGVAARTVAGSCLLIPGEASARSVFTLNATGHRLWELLAEPQSAEMLAQALAGRYRITIERARGDVAAFLAEMQAKGLVVTAAGGSGSRQQEIEEG